MIADQRHTDSRSARHGFVLLAVLVAMMTAILVATALLYLSQTEAAGAAASADTAQSRALVWSGSQAVMSELAGQRQRILAGELPTMQSQHVIYETPTRLGVVRLLPMSGGAIIEPEAAKLDLNHVDSEMFARAAGHIVDPATAANIMAWRDRLGRPMQSITELFDAPGVTVETLHGPLESLMSMNFTRSADLRRADMHGDSSSAAGRSARGLGDLLTVFSVEPNVQSSGHLRINLNSPWSDALARLIAERFGEEAAALMKQVFESGTTFESDAALVKAMLAYRTPLEQWPEILDAFTTDADSLRFGRLDINSASREALLSLPGVSEEQASQMINVRHDLSPAERASAAWPVMRGIIAPESFEAIADRVTTRSWTYRVRIAAGEVDSETQDGPLLNPIVHEVVVDLAGGGRGGGGGPRIAWMRDITLLRDAALIALQSGRANEDRNFTQALADGDSDQVRPSSQGRGSVEARDGPIGAVAPTRASTAPASRAATRGSSAEVNDPDAEAVPSTSRRIGRWRPTIGGPRTRP